MLADDLTMDSPAVRMVSRVHLQLAVRKAPAARCSNSLVIWEDPRLERLAFRFPSIAALLDECSLAAYATALEDEGYSVRGLGELAFASPNDLRHALVDGVGLAPREWEQLLRTLLDAGSRQRAEAAAQGGASGGGPLSAQQTPLCSARLRLVLREAEPFEVAGREALEEECAEEEGGLGGAGEGGGSVQGVVVLWLADGSKLEAKGLSRPPLPPPLLPPLPPPLPPVSPLPLSPTSPASPAARSSLAFLPLCLSPP